LKSFFSGSMLEYKHVIVKSKKMIVKPLVSVLMTAYNREKYIAEAIESVLSSTYTNFELIIVDDCSNDQTVAIANGYKERDSRVYVYVNEKNLGDYPNRNMAASFAKGKYLKYLDSDDLMAQLCLERMVNEMEKHPNCAFGISSRSITNVIVHEPLNSYKTHFFERGILDVGPSATIIRSDIFFNQKGFWDIRCVSDFEFWLRLALEYPMLEMEKDLIYWREHDQQEISFNSHVLQTLEHTIPIIKEKLFHCRLSDLEKQIIIRKYKKSTMRFLIKHAYKIGFRKSFKFKSINQLNFFDAI
jgi:glycosyltransferase involved in cell wall biosynthesis